MTVLVISLITGLIESVIFLVILSRIRPRIEISRVLARWEDPSTGFVTYSFKIRNLSRSQLSDLKIKGSLIPVWDPDHPRVGSGTGLEFEYPTMFDLARRESRRSAVGRSTMVFKFKTPLEPLVTMGDSWAVRVAVSAHHTLTGLASITKQNFVGPSSIVSGQFASGVAMGVEPLSEGNLKSRRLLSDLPTESSLRDLTDLTAHLWNLGLKLAERDRSTVVVERKGTEFDLVTDADHFAEDAIADLIQDVFPGDGVFGEEMTRKDSESGATWIVDPLDGTVNYVHGDPSWCIALAREFNGLVDTSVLVFPELGLTYLAKRGVGAYRNGVKISTDVERQLEGALIATRFGMSAQDRGEQLDVVAELLTKARDVRRSGCTALDIVRVAAGVYDAYVGIGVAPWDVAPASLVLEEAGVRWSNWAGGTEYDGTLVAASSELHAQLIRILPGRANNN